MPRIAVISTGGTIAMRHDPDADGNVPTLGVEELLRSVPGLDAIADLEPIDWGLVPASHLTFAQVLEIGSLAAETLNRSDVDGLIIVQGTDVIEETAFAWDLLPLPAKPVIVVGAMRSASEDGYDGPDNIRGAVAAAADPRLADAGVVVAMAGELHAADDVVKRHSHAYGTFGSPNSGPLGAVAEGRVTLRRDRRPTRLPRWPAQAAGPVPLVQVALGDDPDGVDRLLRPAPAALVVAAAGGGNTPAWLLDAATRLIAEDVPVALTTRCPSGAARPGYGFPGGSTRWWEAGALFTGTLNGLKARVLMSLAIGVGASPAELADLVRPFGGGHRKY